MYAMEGLKREANSLNKEIGTLRKVRKAVPPTYLHGTEEQPQTSFLSCCLSPAVWQQ